MFLPIVAYGDPLLRKKCQNIDKDYPELESLLENMWETMYNSYGVGLAAPQVGKNIRLFIIDTEPFAENEDFSDEERKFLKTFKRVFINAQIIEEKGDEWGFVEGCLSVPNINEEVMRKPEITIEYVDENFKPHKETLTGLAARVIQHEYDHTEGIIFTDKVSPFKKRLLKRKLEKITKGEINVDYPMRFPKLKKRK